MLKRSPSGWAFLAVQLQRPPDRHPRSQWTKTSPGFKIWTEFKILSPLVEVA